MAITAGEDILASDLMHIRKLVTTASEDLTAGDPVGISLDGSGVARALSYGVGASTPYLRVFADTMSISNILVAPISGDKVFICYEVTNTTMKGVVATIDRDTMSVSLGTAVTITTDSKKLDGGGADICSIDTDKVVIGYISNADDTITKSVVCTVSGTTITVGTPQTVKDYASGAMNYVTVVKLNTNKYAFRNSNGASNNEVFACTVSGTVSTIGTAVATGANIIGFTSACQLTTDKFMLFSEDGYVQVYTVSGTTITAGTQQNTSMGGTFGLTSCDIVSHTTNAFVARSTTKAIAGTVSGTVVTFGTAVDISGTSGALRVVSSTVVYCINNNNNGIDKLAISGTTLTKTVITNNKFNFPSYNESARHGFNNTGNGYWFSFLGDSTYGMFYFIEGMSIQFLGTAETTVSRGDPIEVILEGIDENQSGLIAGESYWFDYNATLTRQVTTEAGLTHNKSRLAKAISATQIVF